MSGLNPFQAFADNMKVYTDMMQEPFTKADGSDDNDSAGSTIFFKTAATPGGITALAVVGQFIISRGLSPNGGGFVSACMAEAIVQKSELPAKQTFPSGMTVNVRQPGGSERLCQVVLADDTYTEWRLQLQDVNYKSG